MRQLIRLTIVAGLLLVAANAQADTGGAWRWPLNGSPTVTRGFDPPPVPWAAGHRGVDLRGKVGEPVLAAGAGVVGFAGMLAGRGVVTVHHANGLETTYEPLAVTVRQGQHVETGTLLGHLMAGHGNCGLGAACLHWGLRRGETYLDPLQLVRRGPIRLLPVWRSGVGPPVPVLSTADLDTSSEVRQPPDRRTRGPTVAAAASVVGAVGMGASVLLATSRRRGIRQG